MNAPLIYIFISSEIIDPCQSFSEATNMANAGLICEVSDADCTYSLLTANRKVESKKLKELPDGGIT